MKKISFLFVALLAALSVCATEVTVTIADYAAANAWENSIAYNTLVMDDVVTVTANPTTGTYNNTGKYYTNGQNWRMYQNEAPAIVVTAAEGNVLKSVTFTYASEKTGVIVDAAGAQVVSDEAYALENVTSAAFSVANTSADVTNGQARISAITVVYEAAGEEPEVEKPEPTYTENKLNTYAYGLSSELDEDVLNVRYYLNNSNATSVNVLVYNGEEVVATVEASTTIGYNTVQVGTAGFPAGVDLTWAIEVNGTSVEAPTREEKIYSFYHPSSVDIDVNPENETFGMLLVNEGMQKVKDVEGYVSSGFGAGIFAFTPSFDPIVNGDKPGFNGGIEFTTGRADAAGSTAYAPRRIRISEDGRIFVTSLNTDGNYLWEVTPDNLDEWNPIFKGTLNEQAELITEDSAFIAAPNAGFDVKGSGENLQLAMYSVNIAGIGTAMSGFRLDEYNLGTATEWTTAPSKNWVDGLYAINYTGTQVEYDNEGGLWIASYRGSANETNPGLVHINAEGVEDCKLVWSNVRQAGIRFNNDFTKLVVAGNNGSAKKATVYTVSKDANGAPVLTEEAVIDMAAVGNNLNDFAWDYAGNLYSCGNSAEKLAAWAMPYSGTVVTPAASQYAFQVEEVAMEYYEDVITNMMFDLENMVITGGPSENFQIDVYLPLGEDNMDGSFQLSAESSVAIMGSDAKFIEGVAYEIDAYAPAALVDVVVEWNGAVYQFHLTMSAATMEATVVVVENAVVEVEKFEIFEGTYEHALKMTGNWVNAADGLTYPVLVEIPVYYPEATEPSTILSTVTVGGWEDDDPWLGFGEGELTVTTVDNTVTATGIVENPMANVAIDITISGTITTSGVENATVVVKSVKMIKNGQLIISNDGVDYNAQGAIVK